MADAGALESVAAKFDDWARSLDADEQAALAGWLGRVWNQDVVGHSRDWWLEPGSWSRLLLSRELLVE